MKRIFREPKRRGELTELRFLFRAAEAGYTVSKPYGDSARFDFIVGDHQPLARVQVRCTQMRGKGCYLARMTHCYPPRRYLPTDFDFMAVYVTPCDLWYIVPMAAITPTQVYLALYPERTHSRARFEQYREAWHLLESRAEVSGGEQPSAGVTTS